MIVFNELAGILILATVVSIVMRLLKQPLIVGYIITGILAGPHFLNVFQSTEHIEVFSKIGITTLLFIVGLHMNPKVIKEIGKVSLLTGIGQVLFTTLTGFALAIILGIERIAAIYISIALTFSSTIIILKLISDKGDLHKLYGKIAIGFLLVQDIVATIALLVISSLTQSQNTDLLPFSLQLTVKGLLLFVNLSIISMYTMPKISKFIASSQELLFLFSLSWGLGLASVFYILGFSVEIGALVAGVVLSMTPFAYEAGSRLKPLRDFFIILFFISLGSQMVFENIAELILPVLIFSIFVLVGNPIIMIVIMNLLGFKRKTNFMTGIAIAQISEFSLILATVGFNAGHIDQRTLSIITMVGLITIPASTYLIYNSDFLYQRFEKFLKLLELRKNTKKENRGDDEIYELILFGFDRAGNDFVSAFKKLDKSFIVIDFNPESITKLEESGIPYRYGDAEDVEFLEELSLNKAKLIVSTIPDAKTNLLLTKFVHEVNPKAILIILTYDKKEAKKLYDAGATYIVVPHYLGAAHITNIINKLGLDLSGFKEEREKHYRHLQSISE